MRAEFIPADFYHLPLISHVAAGLTLEITGFDGLVLLRMVLIEALLFYYIVYVTIFLLHRGSANCT